MLEAKRNIVLMHSLIPVPVQQVEVSDTSVDSMRDSGICDITMKTMTERSEHVKQDEPILLCA